jgi:urease accessory protein
MRHNASKTLALTVLLLPMAASAHTGADGGMHHGFVTGFMHPLTGADHLAAMVAVGLWSALAARRGLDLLWAPLAFAGMLLVGASMGLAGVQLPAVEPMIAASLLVLGLLVATRIHLPAAGAAACSPSSTAWRTATNSRASKAQR